jgi:hypothetical protein
VEPLTRGLPPEYLRSLCPLSSTEFVEPPRKKFLAKPPPPLRKKFLGTPLLCARRKSLRRADNMGDRSAIWETFNMAVLMIFKSVTAFIFRRVCERRILAPTCSSASPSGRIYSYLRTSPWTGFLKK